MFDLVVARPETEVNIHNKLSWLVMETSLPTLPLPTQRAAISNRP